MPDVATRGLLVLALVIVGSTPALASNLTGTLNCGPTRMAGATIRAVNDSTQQTTQQVTADGNGGYALSLGDDVYDLVVTPPSGSLCLATTLQNYALTHDQVFDIILDPQEEEPPPPPDDVHITGTFRLNGQPIAGLTAYARMPGGGNPYHYATTDAAGHFDLQVPPGTYNFGVYNDGPMGDDLPQWFGCYSNGYRDFSADTDFQFAETTASVTGNLVVSPSQAPVPGWHIDFGSYVDHGAYTCSGDGSTTTDSDGDFGPGIVFAGANGYASAPGVDNQYNGGYAGFAVPSSGDNVDVDLAISVIEQLAVAGNVTKSDGTPIAGVDVEVYRPGGGGGNRFYGTTDGDGHYSVAVPAGSYRLSLNGYGSAELGLPQYFGCYLEQVDVSSGTATRDFVFRTGYIAGNVTFAANGNPLANVLVNLGSDFSLGGNSSCYGGADVMTDASGHFGPTLQLGDANGYASVSENPGVYYGASGNWYIPENGTGEGDIHVEAFQSYTISGVFTGNGVGIGGASVEIRQPYGGGGPSYYGTTDAGGAYSVVVPRGTYRVSVSKYQSASAAEPDQIYCTHRYVSAESGPVVMDFPLEWARVSGRVTTSTAIPIANVYTTLSTWVGTGDDNCSTYSERTTGADGRYTTLLMHGEAWYDFTPTAGSGYKTVSSTGNLTQDIEQQVVLTLPDIVPPTLTSAPLVIHESNTSVSIQWGTNEATDGTLEFQEGAALDGGKTTIIKPALLTSHIITLRDLTPLTDYVFRVTSEDAAGNSVSSQILSFTTIELPDTEPPVIVDGPYVAFIAPTQIQIGWQTDEPATSHVDYGLAGQPATLSAGSDESALIHLVTIGGLTPLTSYTLTASSTDPDGNGPTSGAPLTVQTPSQSDRTPPQIANLRTECITHEAMAVCWDTDELATSNVAYENASTNVASGISNLALVTEHCMSLTGLAPATTYRISVSSADGGSNTASDGPIERTTATSAADGAPLISDFRAEYVTPTSARVSWTTDVAASSFVEYGNSPGALDRGAGDAAAAETTHEVLITGLVAGADVYVRASATNPCHQLSTAGPLKVVDVDECGQPSACDEGGVCVNSVGSFRCEHAPVVAAQGFTVSAGAGAGTVVGTVAATDADHEPVNMTKSAGDAAGIFALSTSGVLTVAQPALLSAAAGQTITLTVTATDPKGRTGEGLISVTVGRVNECEAANGGCSQGCEDLDDGYVCTCEDGFALGSDGKTCLEAGTCGASPASCDPAVSPMVFYGVVADDAGHAVGSFRCTRASSGAIACDTDADGVLAVSDILWCE